MEDSSIDITYISSLPLSSLTFTTRRLLSNLLDPPKVLPTDGPIRRHRDWRGLASLVNISIEVEANISHYHDKTGRVLEEWMRIRAGTIGELLDHLTKLDRFDVYDDVIASIQEQNGYTPGIQVANQVALPNNNNHIVMVDDPEIITFEDRPGHRHKYHAYVLYAEADTEFVMDMKSLLNGHGFEICTKENLLPGYASQYPPVAKLISERCHRIILVYSPEFLQSNDNSFYRDYAQAVSIEHERRLIPIMYKLCILPPQLRMYHMLYYNNRMNNFWEKLIKSLDVTRYMMNGISPAPAVAAAPPQAATASSNSHSAVNIATASDTVENDSRYFLLPQKPIPYTPPKVSPPPSTTSISISQALDPQAMNTTAPLEPVKTKKRGFGKKIINAITGKKNKKKIAVKQCC